MSIKVLVCEDDVFLREGLTEILTKEGYSVTAAQNTKEAYGFFEKGSFHLVILDVMLPDGNGFDLCRRIRQTNAQIPVLFLTACDDEVQIVRGLDSGGDDYVTKPFKMLELLSRIRALLRRAQPEKLTSKDITVSMDTLTVKKDGESLFLTPTELQILTVLMRNKGVIVTRAMLLQNIWDNDGAFIDDNTLSVHISRLREKIGSDSIITVRGIGYRWEE